MRGVIETFLAAKKAERVSPKTIRWYTTYLTAYTDWLRGQGRRGVLGDVDVLAARAFLSSRAWSNSTWFSSSRAPSLTCGILSRAMKACASGRNGPRDSAVLMLVVSASRSASARRPETSKFGKERWVTLYPEVASPLLAVCPGSSLRDARQVFLTDEGKPFSYQGFEEVFIRIEARSGLGKRFKAHVLRHMAASSFVRAGTGSVIELQRQMGWTDIRMAERYVHASDASELVSRPSPFSALRKAVNLSNGHKPSLSRLPRRVA